MDADNPRGPSGDDIVDTITINVNASTATTFTAPTIYMGAAQYARMELSFRAMCTENFYDQDCSRFCEARNDAAGHYRCDDQGNRVCLVGYQDPSRNCTVCVPAVGCCEWQQLPCFKSSAKNHKHSFDHSLTAHSSEREICTVVVSNCYSSGSQARKGTRCMLAPNESSDHQKLLLFHTQHPQQGSANSQGNAPAIPVMVEKTAQLVCIYENVN